MPDRDGYPTEEELARLRDWPQDDIDGIVAFIGELWWAPDFGFSVRRGRLRLATGGWSGNEDIIHTLRGHEAPRYFHWFWLKHWELHGNGGLYVFDLRPEGEREE